MTTQQRLAIGPADPTLLQPTVITTFHIVPALAKRVEQAGKGYAKMQTKFHYKDTEQIEEEEDEATVGDGQTKKKKRTVEEIRKAAIDNGCLYVTLGLEDTMMDSTEDQIGKAYRAVALLYHPDKLKAKPEGITETDKEVWLKIQEGYEKLMDPERKRKYDSTLPFEDNAPKLSDFTSDAAFYSLLA